MHGMQWCEGEKGFYVKEYQVIEWNVRHGDYAQILIQCSMLK